MNIKQAVKNSLARRGFQLVRLVPEAPIRKHLNDVLRVAIADVMARKGDAFTFFQVGGYDGIAGDPIGDIARARGWRGVICEPQPHAFGKLRQTYSKSPRIKLENVAIAPETGTRPLYYVKPGTPGVPDWVFQLSSFNPNHVTAKSTGIDGLDQHVESCQVPCVPLSLMFRDHGLEQLDLLQIDTEGFDFEVLKLVPFKQVRPQIINFEHRHLSQSDKADAAHLLISNGYRVVFAEYDMVGLADLNG